MWLRIRESSGLMVHTGVESCGYTKFADSLPEELLAAVEGLCCIEFDKRNRERSYEGH
jgi:hypothetical protein